MTKVEMREDKKVRIRHAYYWYSPRGFANEYDIIAVPNNPKYIAAFVPEGAQRITRKEAAKEARWQGDAATGAYVRLFGCYIGSRNAWLDEDRRKTAAWEVARVIEAMREEAQCTGRAAPDLRPWQPARL